MGPQGDRRGDFAAGGGNQRRFRVRHVRGRADPGGVGDVPVTHRQSLLLAACGVALAVAGVAWLVGPWGLIGCGLGLTVVALLVPEGERRGEPSDETVAARAGDLPLQR